MTVQATPILRQILPNPMPTSDGSDSHSWRCTPEGEGSQYWCHGLDLRDLTRKPQQDEPQASVKSLIGSLRKGVPTLLVSECCLCYLETSEAKDVIQYFTDRIPELGLVLYEPTKPHDAFGRQMISNLAARKIKMPTLETYKEPKDQEDRLRQAGFEVVSTKSIDGLWERWVSTDEKERLDELEGLDEVEEWQLLASHYIVAWGSRGKGFDGWAGLG